MKFAMRLVGGVVFLTLLFGCAKPEQIILLPDDNGSVGKAFIETRAGSVVLDKANEGTHLTKATENPEAPAIVAKEEIETRYAAAVAARSRKPAQFILYFHTGGTTLTPASQSKLPEILETLKKWRVPEVAVIGHTDLVGSEETNYRLALDRARSVRDMLTGIGMPASTIEVTSHGKQNPLIATADGVDEPRNRRVEVTIR
ncbi:MAG: OmpA family protein [Magnetococcales bacterium]|nr:OmpA family protein [Magnetococcales bacterium]